jgi:ergothioneine biosynthesis protein EgtB
MKLLLSCKRERIPQGDETLLSSYLGVRSHTLRLCAPLKSEDFVVQSMPEASPTKWHLAHTSWFFETFVLGFADPDYRPFHPHFAYLFNSYYNAIGDRIPRNHRGLLSRPPMDDVLSYRAHVDDHMQHLLANSPTPEIANRTILGLHHEQQHQELLLTDIKHAFGSNPIRPAYRDLLSSPAAISTVNPLRWQSYAAGLKEIGHGDNGFAFDNESPRHEVFLQSFALASRLTTCGEFLRFMDDDGYERPELWLSDGWNLCIKEKWAAPLYWERSHGQWETFTFEGLRPFTEHSPVTHVSFYEADAYARWAGARLPLEAEWETAAAECPTSGSFLESNQLEPAALAASASLTRPQQMFGELWQWTASPYTAYPGYRPAPGALGEYNSKFMCNQMVLRGGSCLTPRSHFRPTYRNFFPPEARWQCTGIRLATDA